MLTIAAAISFSRASASAASLLQLRLAAPLAAQLRAGQVHPYRLHLDARACALGSLISEGVLADVHVAALSGSAPLRTFHGESRRTLEYGFCADAASDYRLEVRGRAGSGVYTLELDAVLARTLAPASPAAVSVKSQRLRALGQALATDPAAADSFWTELGRSGSPLIEPAADPASRLVTFVWHGDTSTRHVAIDWAAPGLDPFARRLERLGQSDVWFTTFIMPAQSRLAYRFVPDPPADPTPDHAWEDRVAATVWRADPFNPASLRAHADLDPHERRSVLALPKAPPETWFEAADGASGSLQLQLLASARLHNLHELSVYVPPGYRTRRAGYPLLIFFDGETYVEDMEAPRLLDHLIAARAIPPVIAVFVRNASGDSRSSELPCNPEFAEFIANELLPFVQGNYAVSRDPTRVGLVGASFGGLASSFIAALHPERFGMVLSQSGSYRWTFARSSLSFDGSDQPGWLIRRFATSARLPLRLYLSAGQFESDPARGGVLESVHQFDAALRAKGYDVRYRETASGHDPLGWRASLPEGLIGLLGRLR